MVRKGQVSLTELESAYRQRFHEYGSVAAAILGDRERGRDAVQDAFARAVRERASFRGDGALEAWLWRLVVNAALSERRRRHPQVVPGELDATAPPSSVADSGVRAAIEALPERQRLILFLRYYADLDYRSIATALEIAPGTVAAALHAARNALRTILTEEVAT
jgi:RNA polymerase sigma-70 factor (ECF subfamily)